MRMGFLRGRSTRSMRRGGMLTKLWVGGWVWCGLFLFVGVDLKRRVGYWDVVLCEAQVQDGLG
jgi:hypothetical protein